MNWNRAQWPNSKIYATKQIQWTEKHYTELPSQQINCMQRLLSFNVAWGKCLFLLTFFLVSPRLRPPPPIVRPVSLSVSRSWISVLFPCTCSYLPSPTLLTNLPDWVRDRRRRPAERVLAPPLLSLLPAADKCSCLGRRNKLEEGREALIKAGVKAKGGTGGARQTLKPPQRWEKVVWGSS